MSFLEPIELGRSTVGNLRNNTWDVYPFMKIYKEDAEAIVAYVESLKNRIKELEGGHEE